jgi:hypothetical protein
MDDATREFLETERARLLARIDRCASGSTDRRDVREALCQIAVAIDTARIAHALENVVDAILQERMNLERGG